MSRKHTDADSHADSDVGSPVDPLTDEAARQRWDLFHRAIAHAKQTNHAEMREGDTHAGDDEDAGPTITIVR